MKRNRKFFLGLFLVVVGMIVVYHLSFVFGILTSFAGILFIEDSRYEE